MKISVITIHRIYNYGSVLQTYATQKLFEEKGHQVEIVDYISPQRTIFRYFLRNSAWGELYGLKKVLYRTLKIGSIILKEHTFGLFRKKYLNLSKRYVTPADLDQDPPVADLYVTGSDQTWNSCYNEGVDRGYFLDFIPHEARRISFVSSFGMDKLPEDEREETIRYLERYDALSVREDAAKKLLAELGFDDAVQLIDPTLQIKKEEWLSLASPRKYRKPYVLLLLLYSEDNGATELAREIADRNGWKVVKLSWEMSRPAKVDKLMTHRSPEDFLSLMQHAEFVVTNSFHGLAFSINLEKQFLVVPRNEFNSRIESLLRLTGLENRMFSMNQVDYVVDTPIDYVPVRLILEKERNRAQSFLEDYL